ncbi:MAG: helix-turn-helix domain-containing protein [Oscillospiraceae bacterium]|nr:helix-turn-helix domain-containing protein [Oscillospiraceae bacterium]
MIYKSISLQPELSVTNIYTIHYFEYSKDYVFEGETHNFWEIVFVDSGAVEVIAGTSTHVLEKGNIIFHKPNEFHALRADGKRSSNLIVISFDCNDPCMDFFSEKILTTNSQESSLLDTIIHEARQAFHSPLHDPYNNQLQRRTTVPFGSERIIKSTLEIFLISLYRRYAETNNPAVCPPPADNCERIVEQVHIYLSGRVNQKLTVNDICRDNLISKSSLQSVFHKCMGCGVIEYFNRLKISAAKQMIREGLYTYSQISNILNFSSYQYFSLQFKKYTRMSPTEYRSSTTSFLDYKQK